MTKDRKEFLKGVSEDYKRLREKPEAWEDYQKEMALWDNTVDDGLELTDFYKNSPLKNSAINLTRSKKVNSREILDFKQKKDE